MMAELEMLYQVGFFLLISTSDCAWDIIVEMGSFTLARKRIL